MGMRIAAMAVMAGTAVTLAPQAGAEPSLNGTYQAFVTILGGNGEPSVVTWVFTPCGSNCARRDFDPPNPETTQDFHLEGNTWVNRYVAATSCVTTIDATTLTGSNQCESGRLDIRLVKVG